MPNCALTPDVLSYRLSFCAMTPDVVSYIAAAGAHEMKQFWLEALLLLQCAAVSTGEKNQLPKESCHLLRSILYISLLRVMVRYNAAVGTFEKNWLRKEAFQFQR